MLSLGNFQSQQKWDNAILQSFISRTYLFPTKTHLTKCSSSSNGATHLAFQGNCGLKRTGFCIYSSKGQRKGGNSVLEVEGFDIDEDSFDDEEENFGDVDGDDEVFVPLHNMKKWLQDKPRGFGEGKVYDTSVEDKLMEEIEQSRKAQLANINKLKNNPVKPNSKTEKVQQEKISKDCKDGVCVRLVDLPKKKNIHRDLQSAFKGVPGMVDIVPVVSGNKRTKDPICKGIAFINFRSQNDAKRFVENFSGQSITFGKVQKQIKCEMDTGSLKSGYEQLVEESDDSAQLAGHSLDSPAENVSIYFESEDEVHESAQLGQHEEDFESQSLPESQRVDAPDVREDLILKSSSLKKKGKVQEKKKKVPSKRNKEKIPKFNIPGSAKRLKIKEKAVLTGAFSKYGAMSSLTTTEQS